MENNKHSYVKLKSETMEKIAAIGKKRESEDQIGRNNPAVVTALVNEAYEAEIAKSR